MNKKQLSLQNSSLFAELERKAKEIEILNIRLEDSEKKVTSLQNDKQQLKNGLIEANNKIISLKKQVETITADYEEQIKDLSAQLEKAKTETPISNIISNNGIDSLTYNIDIAPQEEVAKEIAEENTKETIDEITNQPEKTVVQPMAEDSGKDATTLNEEYISAPEILEAPAQTETDLNPELIPEPIPKPAPTQLPILEPTQTPVADSTPISDLLRDHGAKLIGKVTRVTAEVISKINSVDDNVASSLKTLALGKNESFKFRIMELAQKKSNYDEIINEMNFLAEETIVYLKSI